MSFNGPRDGATLNIAMRCRVSATALRHALEREIMLASASNIIQDSIELVELIESAFMPEPSNGLTWKTHLNSAGFLSLALDSDDRECCFKEVIFDGWLDRLKEYEKKLTDQGGAPHRLIAAFNQMFSSLYPVKFKTLFFQRQLHELDLELRKKLHNDIFAAAWDLRNLLVILSSDEPSNLNGFVPIHEPESPLKIRKNSSRRSPKGSQELKLVSYLTVHHGYKHGHCENYTAAESTNIAKALKIPSPTVG